MSKKADRKPGEVPTTGHAWDGIEEYDNPLPRWWLWVLYATIVWGIGYVIAYPAWPMIQGATPGLLGYSSRGEYVAAEAEVVARNGAIKAELAAADIVTLAGQSGTPLHDYAVQLGGGVFRANCVQCHGAGAQGLQAAGYPSLLDDDWLWGGTPDAIAHTVAHGIRNEQSLDSRYSQMPAFGGMIAAPQITELAHHVRAISGQDHDAALAEAGAATYAQQCTVCHGPAGEGKKSMGAPALNDAVWLYGGSVARISESIANARFGVMPAWAEEYRGASGLDPAEVKAVALYVHQLGGGE